MNGAADAPQQPTAGPATALLTWAAPGLAVLVLGAAVLWFSGAVQRGGPLPVLSTVPGFSLTHSDGTTVTLDDLAGEPWVADFIFSRCVAICPRMTWQLGRIADSLPPRVRFVSISVDPDYDTPEVLAEYADRHGAGWYFLTGDAAAIEALTREAFLLPLDRSPEPIVHSNRFVLVDREARIRGYYDAFDGEALERLQSDVRSLLAER